MNRIRQITFFTILLVPSILLKTLSAQPSQKEAAELFQSVAKQAQTDFSKIDEYVLGLKTGKKI
ncbi:MAG: hypothetical protein LBL24_07450, partial [Bacteroidales bacterium]|nr:hypothetical protein [Bacteroidales bacterium]